MRILATGVTGFLGSKLVERLARDSHEVIVIGRNDPGNENCTFITADITNLDSLQSAKKEMGNVDCIIHLAALVPKDASEDIAPAMTATNVTGTANLLQVFGGSIKNFVYASTAEVYGLQDYEGPITEDTLPRPASFYGASKLAGELICQVYGTRLGIPISMLRFTVMYGAGDTIKRAVPNFIGKALAGQPLELYGGEELRDYIYIDDAVEALFLAAIKMPDGVFNIGSGKGITIKDVANAVVSKISPELKVAVLPRQKKAVDIVLDVTKATEIMGFKAAVFFPDKLEDQIAWQKNQ